MTTHTRLALTAGAALAVVASLLVATGGPAAAAATLPWEPDPDSIGSLSLYDATGAPITGGSVTDAPFAAFVKGSVAGRAGDTKATLFGYLPKIGIAAGAWSGEALTASTDYPNAAAPGGLAGSPLPLVSITGGDFTLADLVADFPNTAVDAYQGLYQLRLKTSGAGQPLGAQYQSAAILVSGSTWSLVSTDADLPTAPGGLSATGVTTSASLTWTPSTAASPITSYTIVATPSTGSPVTTTVPAAGLTFPVTVSGLAKSTTYVFSVKATNAAGTGPTSTTTLKGTKTTATVAPAGVTFGHKIKVTGKVTDASTGKGVAGQSIYLMSKIKGGASYASHGIVATSASDGTFTYTYTPGVTRTYFATSRGAGRLGANSATTSVWVKGTATITLSKSSVKAGAKVTFTGTVRPKTGATVSLQRKEGSKWVTKKSKAASSTGAYAVAWIASSKTDYSWRIVVSGPTFTSGVSATKVLAVT